MGLRGGRRERFHGIIFAPLSKARSRLPAAPDLPDLFPYPKYLVAASVGSHFAQASETGNRTTQKAECLVHDLRGQAPFVSGRRFHSATVSNDSYGIFSFLLLFTGE
jgi:hypothetical protein